MRSRSTSVKGGGRRRPDGSTLLFDVWRLSRATTAVLDGALAPVGMTADEFGVYSVLSKGEGLTPGELARWMSAPPTTVSSYVRRLEERGHVTRTVNPQDRRSYRITLTLPGRAAHGAATERFIPVLSNVRGAIQGPEEPLRQALSTLLDAVETAATAGDHPGKQRRGT
jgi:DNA-binding MarR family transcriptional regulator